MYSKLLIITRLSGSKISLSFISVIELYARYLRYRIKYFPYNFGCWSIFPIEQAAKNHNIMIYFLVNEYNPSIFGHKICFCLHNYYFITGRGVVFVF